MSVIFRCKLFFYECYYKFCVINSYFSTDWKILVDEVEFVPLFDPPHLLKCIRNNFLTKDIEIDFADSNLSKEGGKFGSWDHIVSAYEIDIYSSFLERHVPELTEQHVYAEKV